MKAAHRAGLVVAVLASRAGDGSGQVRPHADHALGTVAFPISCSNQAQIEFNRAVALLHHMTYPRAREEFQRVATTDPRCAMAQWGIAMTLFQPLWPTRPRPQELQRGWEAVQQAKALEPPTERERLFVASAEAFFLEPASPDYWLRIRRWEQATERMYTSFPNDPETAAFFALALLATAPSDSMSRAHADRAAELLLRVYTGNPDHPGAMHYLVHANDTPARARELLDVTHKYETAAPSNPHALHMPTHIYTRLGDWDGVIRGNLRAAGAALESPAGDHGEFVWDEFPHAIEYLIYAYLQQGSDDQAAAELKRLLATARLEPTFKTAFHLASTQARYALERRAWREAAALVPREPATLDWDRFTWPEAIARFARGLGAAHLGDISMARAAAERIGDLEAATRKAGEDLFARNIQVLRLELNAWVAHVEGRREASVALMGEAVELEASTPKHAVTPGPTLPALELLGDLFMERKEPAEALASYRRSIERYPGRFNGLLGAARAADALGDETLARTFYQALLEVAGGGTRQPALQEARNYVAGAQFSRHPIDSGLAGGYQVIVADLNRDGRPDVIALASDLTELRWYENPGWQRHVIVSGIDSPINAAVSDVDGDGIPEIALAHGFATEYAKSPGNISILTHRGDPAAPWAAKEIDRLPTSHRLRFADIDGTGKKVLVNFPLIGAHATAPQYRDHVPLVMYRSGAWRRELITGAEEGVVHGIFPASWNGDTRESLLSAGFLGVHALRFDQGRWTRTKLTGGDPGEWPKSGSSEIVVGRIGGEPFLATIEPWHGNQVVIYRQVDGAWKRRVIDETITDGHTLVVGDFDRDGQDEIVAGERGGKGGTYLYRLTSIREGRWTRRVLDDGLGPAGCAVADLNADQRPDVVCIGSAIADLRWYENR